MLQFKPVHIDDKDWMDELLTVEDSRSADFCFTNYYAWSDIFYTEVANHQDMLFGRYYINNKPRYLFPVGKGNLKEAIEAMIQDAKKEGVSLRITGITSEYLDIIEKAFPNTFSFSSFFSMFDYVYSAEKLATLSGKKLHSKRNHIHRFEDENDWCFEPVRQSNIWECLEMTDKWMELNQGETDYSTEQRALKRVFQHFEEMKMEGGLIRSSGEVIAYCLGEKLNSDTYVVHFEKAFSSIQGAYAIINREFVKCLMARYPEIKYINREEDMGEENIRKAKKSYYPDFMIEKYIAELK